MSCTSADDMKRVFRLPKLPSNTYGEELLRRNYHKSQILGARGEPYASLYDIPPDYDTLMVNKSVRANMLGSLRAAKAQANPSTALTTIVEAASPQKKGTSAMVGLNHPSLLLDKKVLRFYCFFRESVTESPIERERVRKCVLLFHLEDQTMCVVETAVENSGMTQGTLIRRHHFPDIGLQDLDVGVDLELYGKVFHITNCDPFTRDFLERARGHCPPGEEEPVDEFTLRKRLDQLQRSRRAPRGEEFNTNAKMTPQEVRNTTKFLAFDRQVLHFRAVWDDTKSLNGSLRFFSLYYFLADDSIEVIEENENNCGRDPFPSFVRRQKCPRVQREEKFKNTTAALTFCNRRESTPFYTDADLRIGAHLNIFGRDFLLYDCDEHTKSHLRKVHNVQDCTPLDVHPRAAPPLKREPPPHNGFGDEEDSLGSWKHLILKPLKRDGTRYMEHSGTTLKFEMRLDAQGDPCNDLRRFVLTFFISDDTLAIFEPPLRNSGIVAGKFLQRSRIKNPETGQYFRAAELYIGKRLKIHDHVFILLACDERSLTFMEQHSSDFPHSDINTIMNKLRAMILASGTGLYDALGAPDIVNHCIRYDHFSEILRRLALDLSIQEVLTVFRYFEHCGESHILTYGELHKRLGTDATGNFLSLEDTDDWKMLYERSLLTKSYSHNELKNHEKQKTTVRRNRAAYTARHFLELYKERQQLFTTAFHQICDYSPDNLIGAEQFRTVVLERLSVGFEKEDLDALCEKLFPRELRRASYNEFLKLLNGTSSHAHNLEDIIKREH